jgi:type IV secretory pathway TraG/TraD family ATPase VirD4
MSPEVGRPRVRVTVLEGFDIVAEPPEPPDGLPAVRGTRGRIRADEATIQKHALFLGAIGSGKTNAIRHLVRALHATAGPDDVFVFFDTKGDFLAAFGDAFGRNGHAVLGPGGGETWNVFADLIEADNYDRADQVHEIASTIFSEALTHAGQNAFFASGARDVFAAVLLAMSREDKRYSNADLRDRLEKSAGDLCDLLESHRDLAGTARYLEHQGTAQSVLAYMQQTLGAAFSGEFRRSGGFSVREFIREKRKRALFVEYDIAIGARLLPVYRVLIDMAIKEALEIGRRGAKGRVFFVLDEFALLPALSHIGDGVNFGRALGLRFIAGCQNVSQVLYAYGPEAGRSILSGFGTIFAFRLMDGASRDLVRQRFGTNHKQITMAAAVRSDRDHHEFVTGNVIEDWAMSRLRPGECVVAPPEGPPFRFEFLPGG